MQSSHKKIITPLFLGLALIAHHSYAFQKNIHLRDPEMQGLNQKQKIDVQKIKDTFPALAESSFDKALRNNSYEAIKILLEHKAPLNLKKTLRYALANRDVELLKLLLPYIDIKNEQYCDPNWSIEELKHLTYRTENRHYVHDRELIISKPGRLFHECLYDLLDRSWDEMSAFENSHKKKLTEVDEIFSLLCKAGADINATDPHGDTPFLFVVKKLIKTIACKMYGIYPARKMLLEILFKHGSNFNACAADGKTAVDYINEWVIDIDANGDFPRYPEFLLKYILTHGGRVEDSLAWKTNVPFHSNTQEIIKESEEAWQESLGLVSFYLAQDALSARANEQDVPDSSAHIAEYVLSGYLLPEKPMSST